MTTETIDIRIREDGSRVVRRNIEDIGASSTKAADGVDLLKRALGALTAVLAIDKIRQYADAWSAAAGQIRVATKSTEEATAVTNGLFQAAQLTRQGFSDIVQLYGSTARAGKELGASQNQLIKFTENVGKSLAVQGATSQQAQGALMQLGQAMGSGIVRAEEFNSILEGAPYILTVVAKNIDGVDGSIAKLRKKMLDGKLTSREFFDAFLRGTGDIDADFAKSSLTIGQGLTVMSNAFMKYIGELDSSLGISRAFGEVAKWVADNMDVLATALLAVGAAAAVAFAPQAIVAFAGAVRGLWAVVAANPFLALAAAIAAAAVYLATFKDDINAGIDDVTTLGDVFRALGEEISAALGWAGHVFTTVFSGLADIAQGAYKSITDATYEETKAWAAQYVEFYDGVGTGFAGVVKGIARTVDAIAGLLTGMGIAIVRTFAGLPEAISTPFKQMYNVAIDWIEKIINKTIEGINKVRSFVGTELIQAVQFERAQVTDDYYKKYGQGIAASIQDGFESQGGFMEKWVGGLFDRAQQIGKARTAELAKRSGANLDIPLGAGGKPPADEKAIEKAKKEMDQLKNSLRELLNTIAPIPGAYMEMEKARETLNKAEKKGLINATEHAKYLRLLDAHYKDILDPLGRVNRELDQQAQLLGMTADARQVEGEVLRITKDLLKEGVELNEAETKALREKLVAMQELNRLVQAQDNLLANSVGKRKEFSTQLQAIQRLLATPGTGFTQSDANAALVNAAPDLFAGTQQSIQAQLKAYQDAFAQIEAMRQADLINEQTANQMRAQQSEAMAQKLMQAQLQAAQIRLELGSGDWADAAVVSLGKITQGFTTFSAGATSAMGNFFTSFTDGFANSVGRAIVYSEDLNQALNNVAKEALAGLISALVKLGIQWVVNAALGKSLGAAALTAQTAMSAAAAAATAAAWAPAAAMTSLASFGANSAPAMAGITATTALSESLALASMAGFQTGGYTGEMGVGQVAGVVHGKEFVMNAEATARNRPALEAMNRGASVGTGAQVNVSIENYGTSKDFEVQQLSETDIRIIARDEARSAVRTEAPSVISAEIGNPNSGVSKSLARNTQTQRRRA